ncbi:RDD family protein [uncultured Psychroserpens sp.]|uniref:RDD family protein n=1 Tax=uncultured Psychroserpens sp. TaxID=255436 RepID=UPI0026264FDC|nr:RDD family protein [uncultured Psychroserpens sp.]
MEDSIFAKDFENRYELAKIRYRILAFLIDFIIFWSIAMVFGTFYGESLEGSYGFSISGFPALIVMVIGLFLWPISEGLFGQTIGKRFLNLKVVRENFEPIGIGEGFARFFLGLIDYIFLIGIIIAATNKKKKRIGDMVADTIVISTKSNQN